MPPEDPRCPDCGEPIATVADYCLHCRADRGDATVASAVVDLGATDEDERTRETTSAGRDPSTSTTRPAEPTVRADRGWFHPDSLLDDVSTGAVGIASGFVVGFLWMALALVLTESAVGFLAWPVGGVGVALYVGRTRSVFGAVRKACYLTAPTLAAVPLFWFAPGLEGGSFGGRVFAFVVSEVVALPLALVLGGIGYWVGGRAPRE